MEVIQKPRKKVKEKNDRWVLSPELKAKIDRGLQDMKEGKGKEYSMEELRIKMGL